MARYWAVKECAICGEPIILAPADDVDPHALNVFVPPLEPVMHNCGSSQVHVSSEVSLIEIEDEYK
jgi:hypothetical protein